MRLFLSFSAVPAVPGMRYRAQGSGGDNGKSH